MASLVERHCGDSSRRAKSPTEGRRRRAPRERERSERVRRPVEPAGEPDAGAPRRGADPLASASDGYSYRSASAMSMREARRAGTQDATRIARAAKPTIAAMSFRRTRNGMYETK